MCPLEDTFNWLSCSFQMPPSFLEHFHTFWHHKIFQAPTVFSLPWNLDQLFLLGAFVLFYWRMLFRNQYLKTKFAIATEYHYFYCLSLHRARRYIYVNTYIHRHLYFFMHFFLFVFLYVYNHDLILIP